jgi:hypothetical protein
MASSQGSECSYFSDIYIDTHPLSIDIPFPSHWEDRWCMSPATYSHFSLPRRPALPPAPPSSPRFLALDMMSENRLQEVCVFAPLALESHHSCSSDASEPSLTDDQHGSSSDESQEEDRYDASTSELWNTYYEANSHVLRRDYARQSTSRFSPSRESYRQSDFYNCVPQSADIKTHPAPAKHLQHQKSAYELGGRSSMRRASHQTLKALPPLPPPLPAQSCPKRPVTRQRSQTQSQIPTRSNSSWPSRNPPPHLSLFPSTIHSNFPPSSMSTTNAPHYGNLTRPRPATSPCQANIAANKSTVCLNTVEKSVFEDDDVDEKPTIASKLHIRSISAGSGSSKRRGARRSAGEVFKSVFGINGKK